MVQQERLSAVLGEFARTMLTDFPIQAILDTLVERIVKILPVSAVGVTLISEGSKPRYVAASDSSALRFERLQTEIGQGPCLSAFHSGEPVAMADLRSDTRFPLFTAAGLAQGLAAVFTFPLRQSDSRIGALDLYRDAPGALSPLDMEVAQTLADVTAAYLLNAQAREDARATADAVHDSALHDPLTGLPNRLLLRQRVQHAAARARRSHTDAAVLFLDLDQFKQVNDAHGRQVGDALLIAVAERLSKLIRAGDTLARVASDEFALLCEDLAEGSEGAFLAEGIADAFNTPFTPAGVQLRVSATVGLAYLGPAQSLSADLIGEVGPTMYLAKRGDSSEHANGSKHGVIDLREALRTRGHTDLGADLGQALRTDGLDVLYQPLVRIRDGRVTGVEALLRWMHPEHGALSPVAAIAVAEQSGLIQELGAWILDRACRDHGRWLRAHPQTALELSVNISDRQLLGPGFVDSVRTIVAETGMDPSSLVLDVTEASLIEDRDRAVAVLTDITDLGIRVALDDFGAGYSSISGLRSLPIQIVKLDRSLITDVSHLGSSTAIVEAITKLAHVLGLSVTAEGVETERQHETLAAIGCETAQGYLYARPRPASAINALLRTNPLHLPPLSDCPQREHQAPVEPPPTAQPGMIDNLTASRYVEAAVRLAQREAERATAAQSDFLSRMSHELRTPLNAVLGFAQLLELDPMSQAQQDAVHHIMLGGRHLLEMIDDILDLSRIEIDHLDLSCEPVLAGDLVADTVGLMRPAAAAADIEISYQESAPELRRFVLADRRRLRQVLLNLLSNATKYNRPGGRIDIGCSLIDPDHLAFRVADTGPGIGPDDLARLFVPFERLGQQGSEIEGVGIGLALSQRLVSLMGGRLEVESELGSGTTFAVIMPLTDAPADQLSDGKADDPALAASPVPSSVLLYIEDNLPNVDLVRHILDRCPGWTLVHAGRGAQGLELASTSNPALILLDLHLPDMDGIDILHALRADSETAEIPLIVVSADANPTQVRRLRSAGARHYLTKPLDVGEILGLLDRHANKPAAV